MLTDVSPVYCAKAKSVISCTPDRSVTCCSVSREAEKTGIISVEGIVRSVSAETRENASSAMIVLPLSTLTFFSPVHNRNASFPTLVTPAGIVSVSIAEQFAKASVPMDTGPLPHRISVSAVQFINAYGWMVPTLLLSFSSVRLLQSLKAFSCREEIPS